MQYRTFGRLGWQVSALGFGAMRLPTIGGDAAQIDEAEATRMIRYAIDHGVNYIDTAYPYHAGNSERLLGRILQDGYRERVHLATKMPCWMVESAADFDRFLDEQLARLQTDHLDLYLLHGLRAERWQKVRDLGVREWAERKMAEGKFRRLGFSFHDSFAVFKQILDEYDGWAMCQIQYNYMDEQHQAGVRGLRLAAARGLAVVVMEPLRGGLLAGPPPASVQALWDTAPVRRTPAEWALLWLWDQPEVSVVLSGMSSMSQVQENIASVERGAVGSLSAAELELIARVREQYRALTPIPCTDCRYCQPCPNNVAIPRVFEFYNMAIVYNAPERARQGYIRWLRAEERADRCLECGECESKCPQGIQIIEWLKTADRYLMVD
ncbi:MAG: aldo/keto reductase [Anaerolineae bacterium]|nr:aldo/keto reductase [Anaerolineae bacterium]